MILAAEDSEDLQMLSARLQDAAGKLKNFVWLPKQRRFACVVNRYRWEESKGARGSRVRSGLKFDSVLSVQSQNIKRGAPEAIVSLLAIKFTGNGAHDPDQQSDPGGVIELQFAGGGAIKLTVECIDAELSDLTTPWEAKARPKHESDR